MAKTDSFMVRERCRAERWKAESATLPVAARRPARYVNKDGVEDGPRRGFCLPGEFAALSLLPEVRQGALELFAELGVPWHAGVDGGPSNHLLSSQVQCVNALGQMVTDPARCVRAFGTILGTKKILEVEPGRSLTFEFIGDRDVFGESPGAPRVRGAKCTSVDAAFLHETLDGTVELVLVEWKYTESYRPRTIDDRKDAVRRGRYQTFLTAEDSPVRADVLDFVDLLDEPLYQLMRQQLFARELERSGALGCDRVRVVHVCPVENKAYQDSLRRPTQLAVGSTVKDVWAALLRQPERFTSVDNRLFLDPAITSAEYCSRYGDGTAE